MLQIQADHAPHRQLPHEDLAGQYPAIDSEGFHTGKE